MDEHLNFKTHINLMNAKLKRANNLLALSRHYLPINILKQVYYAQFHSHLSYGCQIWGFDVTHINQTITLQKKAVRLMTFSNNDSPSDPIFKELRILKLEDVITTNNVIFAHKTLNNTSPSHFKNYYQLHVPNHDYDTVNNPNSTYSIPAGSIELMENDSGTFKYKCAQDWNDMLKTLSTPTSQTNWLLDVNILRLKNLAKAHFLSAY